MPSPLELVELQQTLYESRNPTRKWLHTTRRDFIVAAIRQASEGPHRRALEIGPGSGVYLGVLSQHFDQVVAADIEQSYLSHLEPLRATHPNLSLVLDDATHSNLDKGSFDLVLCTEVIEHIADSRAVLREMHMRLRPGGKLILSTPQKFSPLELAGKVAFLPGIINIVRMIYREPILETGHINLLTENEVREQLKTAGFRIIEAYKSGMYMPLIAEFLGAWGLSFEKWLEVKIRGTFLDGMLWTQYYIAEA